MYHCCVIQSDWLWASLCHKINLQRNVIDNNNNNNGVAQDRQVVEAWYIIDCHDYLIGLGVRASQGSPPDRGDGSSYKGSRAAKEIGMGYIFGVVEWAQLFALSSIHPGFSIWEWHRDQHWAEGMDSLGRDQWPQRWWHETWGICWGECFFRLRLSGPTPSCFINPARKLQNDMDIYYLWKISTFYYDYC